jgi:hypothetical protein
MLSLHVIATAGTCNLLFDSLFGINATHVARKEAKMKNVILYPLVFLAVLLVTISLFTQTEKPVFNEPVKQEEAKAEPKVVDNKQLRCLADNIYYEAGHESTEGKAAVARVVLNRIQHGFGPTPCKVVYQANLVKKVDSDTDESFWIKVCQFSWVCEGKSNPNRNSKHYQTSLQVAYDVLAYDAYREVIPMSVLFFHNLSVQPQFGYGFVKQIGNHIFYSKPKKKHRASRAKANIAPTVLES